MYERITGRKPTRSRKVRHNTSKCAFSMGYVSELVLSTWHVLPQMNTPPAPSDKYYHYLHSVDKNTDTERWRHFL